MKTLIILFALLLPTLSFTQSTVTVNSVHTIAGFEHLEFNIKPSEVKYSKSSRLQINLTVEADVDQRLLEYIAKNIKIEATFDQQTKTYNININKLDVIVIKSKAIDFKYSVSIVMPEHDMMASTK